MSINPRKISVQIVYNILKGKSNLSDELTNYRKNPEISSLDLRFISELATGTIRNLEYIDYVVSLHSNIKLNKIAPYVMCVLRCGAYQILFLDKVPHSAAVNEAVKLIKNSSDKRLSGFVNAVLRKIALTNNEIPLPEDEIKRNSIKYSCPEWIVSLWKERLGSGYEELLKAMNTKPETILRANTLKTNAHDLACKLNTLGWECSEHKSCLFSDVDYLISARKIEELQACEPYVNGMFYIQDSAGAYVAQILNPKIGSVVFDMCASPGGKTTHIAEKMKNKGKIYAFDVSQAKIDKINQNASRLGIDIIDASVMDSSIHNKDLCNMADYLLVDAPCSGLGIIRKKPDIKYLRKHQDSSELAKISLDILNASAPYLKSGGTMVFSTCTTVYEENEEVLFKFLKANPCFHLEKIICNKENEGYITLYPHTDGCDGFFISLLKKE